MPDSFDKLADFLPEHTYPTIKSMIVGQPLQIKVSKPRKSKFGDYRPSTLRQPIHRISVNGDLNTFAFMITLIHELAHFYTFKTYGRRARPHGTEWKSYFKQLVGPFFNQDIFPENIEFALKNYMANPAASSCSDTDLYLALASKDEVKEKVIRIQDLLVGSKFIYNGNLYKMIGKLRTRYSCQKVDNNALYYFNAITPIRIDHVE